MGTPPHHYRSGYSRKYGVFYSHLKARRWWWVFFDLLRLVYVPVFVGLYGAGQSNDVQLGLGLILACDLWWLCVFMTVRPEAFTRIRFQYVLCLVSEMVLVLDALLRLVARTAPDSSQEGPHARGAAFRTLSVMLQTSFVVVFGAMLLVALLPKAMSWCRGLHTKLTRA